mmetsp:Transcript_22119/g.74939  ORF Transcript_22119/g.74939 Transcript_22119/m.74939 type:complete len:278 (+) Transcript_22119:944-1777(+)
MAVFGDPAGAAPLERGSRAAPLAPGDALARWQGHVLRHGAALFLLHARQHAGAQRLVFHRAKHRVEHQVLCRDGEYVDPRADEAAAAARPRVPHAGLVADALLDLIYGQLLRRRRGRADQGQLAEAREEGRVPRRQREREEGQLARRRPRQAQGVALVAEFLAAAAVLRRARPTRARLRRRRLAHARRDGHALLALRGRARRARRGRRAHRQGTDALQARQARRDAGHGHPGLQPPRAMNRRRLTPHACTYVAPYAAALPPPARPRRPRAPPLASNL